MNITPPPIKNEAPINHDTNTVNNNISQTNSSTANGKYMFLLITENLLYVDGRNVLRIKLNIKKPAAEEAKVFFIKKIQCNIYILCTSSI